MEEEDSLVALAPQIKRELRIAARSCYARGLVNAAKWASELAVAVPVKSTEKAAAGGESNAQLNADAEDPFWDDEEDRVMMARCYFDSREFSRCSFALAGSRSRKALFLHRYALFLDGEKVKEENTSFSVGTAPTEKETTSDAHNQHLLPLKTELAKEHASGKLDGFDLYLYGLVLSGCDLKREAIKIFSLSVNAYPWNWSAWSELSRLLAAEDEDATPHLADHWMSRFFQARAYLDIQKNVDAVEHYERLLAVFPDSGFLRHQIAMGYYDLREFVQSEEHFVALQQTDPFRLDYLDTLSNILFVTECSDRLAHLAHNASRIDKYRPETCCVVGNYYSMRSDHEKAALYFQRALKLNRRYLTAWTLMGHEYIELKNLPAAIEAYRRAIDISPRDYRAWYGLGLSYEILGMSFYSLYYFRRAATVRPYDARMWLALANAYENMKRLPEAIACFKRALANNDEEGIALDKLAHLHEQIGEHEAAAHYYTRVTERAATMEYASAVRACKFLAQHFLSKGENSRAEVYLNRLLDFGGPDREIAKIQLQNMRISDSLSIDGDGGLGGLDCSRNTIV